MQRALQVPVVEEAVKGLEIAIEEILFEEEEVV